MKDKLTKNSSIGELNNAKKDRKNLSSADLKTIKEFHKSVKQLTDNISKNLNSISADIKIFVDSLIEQSDVLISHIEKLSFISQHGWYVGFEVLDTIEFSKLKEIGETKDLKKIEQLFLDNADEFINDILDLSIKKHPKRVNILNEIKSLYQSKYYYSTIILSYSQIDGISTENWGFGFFDKQKPNYELKLSKEFEPSEKGVMSLLANQLGFSNNEITINSKDESVQTNKDTSFNRHLVMHGHSTGYGTRLNAIRSIFLFDFINSLDTYSRRVKPK